MRIGSRYKIARRYGAELFEKTSTQKFALREGNRGGKKKRGGRTPGDFARQLAEKQKARFLYGLSDRQMRRAARQASTYRTGAAEALLCALEMRLDNAAYRAGLAATRQASRQAASHGHLCVNGRRTNVPSRLLRAGDIVTMRPQSAGKKLWPEGLEGRPLPAWLSYDADRKALSVVGAPKLTREELPFSIDAVLEFYRR